MAEGSPARGRRPHHAPLPAAGDRQHLSREPRGTATASTRPPAHGDATPTRRPATQRRCRRSRRKGLTPWQAESALPRDRLGSTRKPRPSSCPTGGVDPLTGRSYYQIAMASRSLHRSQDMGMLQEPGPTRPRSGGSTAAPEKRARTSSPESTRTSPPSPPRFADPARRAEMARHLDRVEALTQEARRRLSTPDLVLDGADADRGPVRACAPRARWCAPATAVSRCSSTRRSRWPRAPSPAPRESTIDALCGPRGRGARRGSRNHRRGLERRRTSRRRRRRLARESGRLVRGAGPGRRARRRAAASSSSGSCRRPCRPPRRRPSPTSSTSRSRARSTTGARPRRPCGASRFEPPPLTARAWPCASPETPVTLEREAAFRLRDQAIGEIRRPVRAAPPVDVAVDPKLLVWPLVARGAAPGDRADLQHGAARPRPDRDRAAGRLARDAPAARLQPRQARRSPIPRRAAPALPRASRPAARPRASPPSSTTAQRLDLGVRLIDYGYIRARRCRKAPRSP